MPALVPHMSRDKLPTHHSDAVPGTQRIVGNELGRRGEYLAAPTCPLPRPSVLFSLSEEAHPLRGSSARQSMSLGEADGCDRIRRHNRFCLDHDPAFCFGQLLPKNSLTGLKVHVAAQFRGNRHLSTLSNGCFHMINLSCEQRSARISLNRSLEIPESLIKRKLFESDRKCGSLAIVADHRLPFTAHCLPPCLRLSSPDSLRSFFAYRPPLTHCSQILQFRLISSHAQ